MSMPDAVVHYTALSNLEGYWTIAAASPESRIPQATIYDDDSVLWGCPDCTSSAISIEVYASVDTETMAATSWSAKPTSDAMCAECGLEATVYDFFIDYC